VRTRPVREGTLDSAAYGDKMRLSYTRMIGPEFPKTVFVSSGPTLPVRHPVSPRRSTT
jgi:hypothetical protein